MKRTTSLSALICALALATAPTSAEAQAPGPDVRPDHFKCYRMPEVIGDTGLPAQVTLVDQFDAALGIVEEVVVFVHLRFCNPVVKRFAGEVSGNPESENHLTLYAFDPIDGKAIRGVVHIVNQFGKQKLEIESANILAVPTVKNPFGTAPPISPDLDHYKCYFAEGDAPKKLQVVGLKDQFETVRHKLREPVLFCNPVRKTIVDGDTFGILNPEDHLTCYKISIATDKPYEAFIANQFTGPNNVEIFAASADLLCVPTEKANFKLDPNFGLTAPGR